ncbi:MAG: hypothetical protein PHE79_09695 [Eubacteriales bacterium]|nr:hypothetical protein [Eubacteriales bacterium]
MKKGKQIVIPQHKKIRCETHTCKGMSGYSIGLRGFAPEYRNVCPDCMDEIVRQGGVLLYGEGWTPEAGFTDIGAVPDAPAESLDESVDALNGEEDIPDPLDDVATPTETEKNEPDPLSEEPAPADAENFYVCKDCGAKFKKPSAKMEYISHRSVCSKKQESK